MNQVEEWRTLWSKLNVGRRSGEAILPLWGPDGKALAFPPDAPVYVTQTHAPLHLSWSRTIVWYATNAEFLTRAEMWWGRGTDDGGVCVYRTHRRRLRSWWLQAKEARRLGPDFRTHPESRRLQLVALVWLPGSAFAE